jgi:hypothetical protein
MENPRHHHHSFFWPTVLIGVGLIWLLVNMGIIAPISVGTLLQFWPLILIVLGLDILFSRSYAWVGSVVGILAVVGLVAFLIMQPKVTAANGAVTVSSQVSTQTFTEPLGDANSVTYNFETASEPVYLYALNANSTNLIDADLNHLGSVDFNVTGTTSKMVSLSETSNPTDWFTWTFPNANLKWNVGLTKIIPVDIKLDGGSGSINADLEGVQLRSLSANLGSGSSEFQFPQSEQSQLINLNSGSGSVSLTMPNATDITVRIQSGSGSLDISLPSEANVRVEVDNSGSGSLSFPDSLVRSSGSDQIGTWQTQGYDQATHRILIKILDRGSGSISIH